MLVDSYDTYVVDIKSIYETHHERSQSSSYRMKLRVGNHKSNEINEPVNRPRLFTTNKYYGAASALTFSDESSECSPDIRHSATAPIILDLRQPGQQLRPSRVRLPIRVVHLQTTSEFRHEPTMHADRLRIIERPEQSAPLRAVRFAVPRRLRRGRTALPVVEREARHAGDRGAESVGVVVVVVVVVVEDLHDGRNLPVEPPAKDVYEGVYHGLVTTEHRGHSPLVEPERGRAEPEVLGCAHERQ